jgi:hypothetical protein
VSHISNFFRSTGFDKFFKNEVFLKRYGFCPACELSVTECSGTPFAKAVTAVFIEYSAYFKRFNVCGPFLNTGTFFNNYN